jgi:hypothetical protein
VRQPASDNRQAKFTDHFAVEHSLTAGDNGTTATPFRR